MSEWKPIETMPDKGYFLAYDLKHKWRDRPAFCVVKRVGDKIHDRHGFHHGNLTHWQELPSPPVINNPKEFLKIV